MTNPACPSPSAARPSVPQLRWFPGWLLLVVAFAGAVRAQSAAPGTITGRVFNSATKEYVRNAEVRIAGTNLVTYAEDGGFYRLVGVSAGEVTVAVSYTGCEPLSARVTVAAGRMVTRDFELQSLGQGAARDAEVVKLSSFVVSAEREGQAKAVMERLASINAKNVVASDNYGELTMGDVGEFMKSMPGISLDYVEVDTSSVRIGGLDPKYSLFTTDGARMPTGTSNNNTGRQNSFEQMSITGIESIEFNNTLVASMDADSPGGSINLRSKYAFQRKGRELVGQFGAIGTSDARLVRDYFPDDRKHHRILPSGQIGYGDVLLGGRLGLGLTASYNANFVEQDRNQIDWIYPTTGPYAGGVGIPYRAMWRAGPKMTHREAVNLTTDFKLTDRITLSLRSSYSDYDVEYVNQYTYLYFGTTSVSNAAAGSTATHIIGAGTTNTRVGTEYSHRFADTPVILLSPKIEYKGDTFKATLRGGYSRAEYNFRAGMKGFFQRNDSAITNLGGFVLDRPSTDSVDWTIRQTGVTPTNDWSNPENWKSFGANNVRNANSDTTNEMFSGYLDLEKQLVVAGHPFKLLAGGGARTNGWNSNEGGYQAYTFVGPTGVQAQATVPYTRNYRARIEGFDAGNFNDLNWRADANYATYDLFLQHPEYFQKNDAANLQRLLANTKGLQEQISAAYAEAQTRYERARFDFGVRYEKTSTDTKIWDLRSTKEIAAAGLSTGTVEGVLYQYRGGRQSSHHGSYDNWFLSGGTKYDFTRKLVGQVAFSESILRADYGNIAGSTSVNDTNLTVTVPNAQLKPERSTKFYAGLHYYLEPSGVLGLSFYRLKLQDMQVTGRTIADPESVGYGSGDYPGYTYISTQNDPSTRYTNGLTCEYNQQLSFLPRAFKGLGLYGSITRVMADGIRVGTPNKSANWGVKYRYGPVSVQVNGTWQGTYRTSALSNTPATVNGGVLYHAPRELWGLSAGYRLTRHFELMLSGRNILNAPDIVYSNIPSHWQQYSIYGSLWTAAVKGTF